MEPGVEAAEFGKIVDRRTVFVPVLRQGRAEYAVLGK